MLITETALSSASVNEWLSAKEGYWGDKKGASATKIY